MAESGPPHSAPVFACLAARPAVLEPAVLEPAVLE